MGQDLGVEVLLDGGVPAEVAVGVAGVGEGDVLGVALLGVGFGVALAVCRHFAGVGEQWAFDGDGPVAEIIGGEHLRELGVGVVEGVVEGEDTVAGGLVEFAVL